MFYFIFNQLMPFAKRNFANACVGLLLTLTSLSAHAVAPDVPTGLTSIAYSRNTGELFWTRPAETGLRYEVVRNGTVLTNTDGVSYFDRTLSSGTTFIYEVIAINSAGERSAAATDTLVIDGPSSGNTSPTVQAPLAPVMQSTPNTPGDLNAPTGLVAFDYSENSGEIFWARPETPGLSYEVYRNGSLLTITDGTSYYDITLAAGTTYTYSIIAIDDSGDSSPPTSVTLITDGQSNSTVANNNPQPSTPVNPVASTIPTESGDLPIPLGLNGEAYDDKSGEIRWTRSSTVGLSYDVFRDGVQIATSNGTSYYDDSLSAGTTYTYTIIAKSRTGNTSPPASTNLTTTGNSSGNVASNNPTAPTAPVTPVAPTTPSAPGGLPTPTGLNGEAYDKTSIEIRWNRSTTPGLSYEVRRDGTLLTMTDGTSYYDNTLSAGTTYTYTVVAFNSDGDGSDPASVSLTTDSNSGGNVAVNNPPAPTAPVTPVTPAPPVSPVTPTPPAPPVNNGANYFDRPVSPDIIEPADVFTRDGYLPYNVIRLDVRTVTTPGVCNTDEQSGCTLADVIADIDGNDDFKVDIPVHVSGDDFPDDGSVSNAELRQRGGGSRNGAQKSFRIKFDSKTDIWRGERHFQLNKHPFESNRIRNKLAFDVMIGIPHLPSLRTQFVNLWIDDGNGPVDYGLFTHVERVNGNFLRNRGWDDDGNLYKAEDFRFDRNDLSNTRVDADGEPLDEDIFESSISIDNGDDHRPLQNMLQAINDPNRSTESILSQYFDRTNAMAWVATNILLRQADAVRHNYILYNPVGSEKFYFIPWDYDAAMGRWNEPPRDFSNDSLRQRTEYGYGLASGNVFLQRFYRLPGIHNEIVQAVNSLRNNYVTDQFMTSLVDTHFSLAGPFQQRLPDSQHNPSFTFSSAAGRASAPRQNAEALNSTFNIPIGPVLQSPVDQSSQWLFSWSSAYDVVGSSGGFTYRLQVARTPTFDNGTILADIDGISDQANNVTQNLASSVFPSSGTYYARVFALPANQPERFFQVSDQRLFQNGTTHYGVIRFDVD